jgi:hypothetical protein
MMSKMQIDKQPKTNNPAGRPVGEYGKRSSRTVRIPDSLWDKIPGNKSEYIIKCLSDSFLNKK